MNVKFLVIIVCLFLVGLPLTSAFQVSSSSYGNLDGAIHFGSAGSDLVSSTYSSPTVTTTYQQGGSTIVSSNFNGNSGWLTMGIRLVQTSIPPDGDFTLLFKLPSVILSGKYSIFSLEYTTIEGGGNSTPLNYSSFVDICVTNCSNLVRVVQPSGFLSKATVLRRLTPARIAMRIIGARRLPYFYDQPYYVLFRVFADGTQRNTDTLVNISVNITKLLLDARVHQSFDNESLRLREHTPFAGCVDFNTSDGEKCSVIPFTVGDE